MNIYQKMMIKKRKKTSDEQQLESGLQAKLQEVKEQEKAVKDERTSFFSQISAQRANDQKRSTMLAALIMNQADKIQESVAGSIGKRTQGERDADNFRTLHAVLLEQALERETLLQDYEQQIKDIQTKYQIEKQRQMRQLLRGSKSEMMDFIRQEQNKLSEQKNNSLGMGEHFKEDLNAFYKTQSRSDLHEIKAKIAKMDFDLLQREKAELEKAAAEMTQKRLEQIRSEKEALTRHCANLNRSRESIAVLARAAQMDAESIKALTKK